MKNQLKFRVWSKKDNQYLRGTVSALLVIASLDPNNYIVEQFTGAKDANGEDIFVGDTAECRFNDVVDDWSRMSGKSKGTVKFCNKTFQYRIFFVGRKGVPCSNTIEKHHRLKITGNVNEG